MAMSNGTTGGMASEINVTPMIDVLLVLLIIFMVIAPAIPKGEGVQAPRPQLNVGTTTPPETVVLEMLKGNGGELKFMINQKAVARKDLSAWLAEIYPNRSEWVLFLKGDDELCFTQVADVIDISHSAGVNRVGLMTPKVLTGQ